MLSILKTLEEFDQWLFMKLNSGMTNPVFDVLMPFLRHGTHWAPLYLFLGVFVGINFGKKGLWWILFFVVTVAFTDMIGTYVFKHNVLRLRPCNDPDFFYNVRLLVQRCSGGSSFTSNHAANHFGMATFFLISFYPILKKWAWIGMVWAVLIAYAQVYVGVHYPFDVLAGALLGILVGLLTGKLFKNRYGFPIFDNKPTMTL
ncbi:MAG: phosphatase PAP2 family protein [Chitinophagaceae bacterium]|nr:phosphatase PAP2 family protein [Chitinophagaceae bacterium]